MEGDKTAIDRVNFLTQSPVRVRILQLLDDQGPLEKRTLTQQLEGCRTTVQRNLDALEEQGWIENQYPEYAITQAGAQIHEYTARMLDRVRLVEKIEPLFEHVPADELSFDVQALADATVVTAEAANPYAPVNRHIAGMKSADVFRGLLPAVGLQPMTVARDCVTRGQRQEVIVDDRVAATLRTDPTYQSIIEELLAADNCELLVTDDELAYYLGLFDAAVQIGLEDDAGTPVALIESNASEVRAWAEQRYETARKQATPFAERTAAEPATPD